MDSQANSEMENIQDSENSKQKSWNVPDMIDQLLIKGSPGCLEHSERRNEEDDVRQKCSRGQRSEAGQLVQCGCGRTACAEGGRCGCD